MQLLLRGSGGSAVRRAVAALLPELRGLAKARDVRLVVDVDPQHML
jgi:hypothetical protein